MIEGEFLTTHDLGPFGRLVAPGELLVLEPYDKERGEESQDQLLVQAELEWVEGMYREVDAKAARLRKRLRTAHLGAKADIVREWFMAWTIEAATYALCARYLHLVAKKLAEGEQQCANPRSDFKWANLNPIKEVTARVVNATDAEIIGGAVFRAR